MNIAIIPARGGSSRISQKNIKDFCGKPILAYAISAAKNARIFDKIIVSTDSAEIQAIAVDLGADSPHLREKYSDDFATTIEVLAYEAERLGLQKSDSICCIYPCSPLLQSEFLKKGFEKFLQNQNSYIFSACEYNSNPLRSFFIKDDKIQMLAEYFGNSSLTQSSRELEKSSIDRQQVLSHSDFSAQPTNLAQDTRIACENSHQALDSINLATIRSQDLETLYYDAGQFYFGSVENFLAKKPIFSKDSMIVKIPQIYVVDINTNEDWEIAELKYKILAG